MKRLIILCMTLVIFISGCKKNDGVKPNPEVTKEPDTVTSGVTESEPTKKAEITPTIQVTPSTEVTPTVEVTPTAEPIQSVVIPNGLEREDDVARFRATVISVDGKQVIVRTDEFNSHESETVVLHTSYITTYGERDLSKYVFSMIFPTSGLQPGDEILVETEYYLINGKKVITDDIYCIIDLMKSAEEYDFAREYTILDALEQAMKKEVNPMLIEYTCCPDSFAKPYEGASQNTEQIQSFLDLISVYTIFETDETTPMDEMDFDLCAYLTDGVAIKNTMIGFTKERVAIYQKQESGKYQLSGMYRFYHGIKPGWNLLMHLFLTEQDLDQIAKDYVSYEDEMKEEDHYFQGEGITSYRMHEGYQFDLNQDGVKEKIMIGFAGSPLGSWYGSLENEILYEENAVAKIYINGEPCYELPLDATDVASFLVLDLNPDDNWMELAVRNAGSSEDYYYSFYHYDHGKVEWIGNVDSSQIDLHEQTDGSYRIIGNQRLLILQTWEAPVMWELNEKGIQKVNMPLYYPVYSNRTSLICKIRAYEEMSLESKEVILLPQNVEFLATDDKNWVQLQMEDGSQPWIYLENGWMLQEDDILEELTPVYGNISIDQIFDGLSFAD